MSLRHKKRSETRERIIEAAVDLFLERGFQATLVDDIATASTVSRRTFFNYFPSKQDVLAEWFREQGAYLVTCVSERPKDEPVWTSLQHAYGTMHETFGRNNERVLKLRRILVAEPLLLAKKHECLTSTLKNLTPVIELRVKKTGNRALVALVLVQAAMGAYNSACADWEANPLERKFKAVLRQAFNLAEPATVRSTRDAGSS